MEDVMKELYSNADDCYKLAILLKSKLREKIEFSGSTFQEMIIGNYHSLPYSRYESFLSYKYDIVEFCYTFLENGFLRISVSDSVYKKASMGHKLAVLSDLYQVISEKYKEPSVFYTLKDDDENSINLEWVFIEKEETIEAYKNGTMFDDAEVDELIIIDEEKEKRSLTNRTKELISKTIGVPFEMIYLVDENINDFLLYKKEKNISYKEDEISDEYSTKALETTRKQKILKK